MKSDNTPIEPDAEDMQQVFDEAEAILQALHSLEGCEMVLCDSLDQALARDPQLAHKAYAVINSIGKWRMEAAEAAQKLLKVALGKA
ncbi:hypothetical protein D2T29_00375 [Sinirhodobacter populi]|uniref:Uncharacterized protein n=1 Tax=Paenirhodobacter populi TaxID=2306993 RepID=A0A443KQ26_9RHOB|nr:hypothetical protein [Sinirhodobacter populi]RWR34966.1 hypothetical protein D2T29_00375 [Sinirhodobacter populi]